MTTPDQPDLNDVIDPQESAPKDRQEHGKASPRPNDEALQHRTEQERQAVGSDDAAPGGAEPHAATD
ncbi:hypothetical protein OF117_19335 [Geodermatophilus sp. YIM 151500]|uniref:hypothetical protein n=1 Tax=Geodermatophilus sp. YIM 151500 TaxID=2984531 RepID=UPI0021E482DF|nr:hypothetical protein [Geodermatophilus sp. YIM 151500]MCV2491503.1 hypothetical protein [Geodermatophilus sp. YIM 151500]